jgi:arylsulfatase
MRWPGVIEPGRVINDITSLQDFIPTFAAAAGEDNLVEKVKKGYTIGSKSYKVHLDGYNLLPFLSGEEKKCPREGFLYWSDDGDLLALRAHEYKIHFKEQRAEGLKAWREPFAEMRLPKVFNLRAGPLRVGRRLHPLRQVVHQRELRDVRGAAARREMAGELQGVPAAREGGELQH